MTWAFLYFAVLFVGLVTAGAAGLLGRAWPFAARHRHLVVPHPELHFASLNLLFRRLALALMAFGLVGLALMAWDRTAGGRALPAAVVAAALAGLAAIAVLRRPCPPALSVGRATVVRDIQPGGYGQIRFEQAGRTVVMAANSVDGGVLPAGTDVEVVDCTRSVVTVRRLAGA